MTSKTETKSKAVTVTTKQKNGVVPTTKEQVNIDRFLQGSAAENSSFLKFIKGEWSAGVDAEVVPVGTEMAVNVAGIASGHLKWVNREVVGESMTLITDGMFAPRETLGDLDQDLWEVDDNGVPKDCWVRTSSVPIKGIESGDELVYSTSSRGGLSAVGKLVGAIRKGQRKGETGVPIIKIDTASYDHKKYGPTPVPVLALVGFRSEEELMGGAEPESDLDDEIPEFG